MQAALPMYFPPREAVEAFWAALAGLLRTDAACAGYDIPAALRWPEDVHAQWLESDLLLSQACGYPFVTMLKGRVQLVGTFAYEAVGAQGIYCRSQLICRADDVRQTLAEFAGSTVAFNDTISQSGYNALRALVATTTTQRPFFDKALHTGSHYRSIEAVRTGQADMASIDPVSWAHWQRSNPSLGTQLRVFEQTQPYPGLPLITALETPPAVLQALRKGLHTLAHDAAYAALRKPLLISGFEVTDRSHYQMCVTMQEQALLHGVRDL
ncbi:PhnD/SsuA/transferrin family substrate-binding protein [Rhodoferax sp. GW822-FHT02A01]|uniref:phosphate/phosphite/phosphonate ABC transporter substrate-binding protein n=1 Tax=Rhodoferax sp. GW822-FHT02A01 TaxID=3141537 RepID=UPI00315D0757